MKISTINSINNLSKNYSNSAIKKEENNTANADLIHYLSNTPAAISFQATRRMPLKSLELQNESAKKIVTDILAKLEKYNAIDIRGNFLKPFKIETEGSKYLFLLDNSDSKLTTFTIKNLTTLDDNFSSLQDSQSQLKFTVDENGKIIKGNLSKKISDKFTKRFDLQKVSDNINRIRTNEGLTIQNSRNGGKFTTKPDLCKNRESKEFDMYKDFTEFDTGLSEIFFKLVQGRSLYA